MSNFFYAVIVPKGVIHSSRTKIVSGRVMQRNALEAVRAVEQMHPNALEVHVRKEKGLIAA